MIVGGVVYYELDWVDCLVDLNCFMYFVGYVNFGNFFIEGC